LAPSIKSAILADDNIGNEPPIQGARGRQKICTRLCLPALAAPKLVKVTRQATPPPGRGEIACGGNSMNIHPASTRRR
jgi:hypothetical protein